MGGCNGAACRNSCRNEFQWRKLFFGIVPGDRWYFTHPQWTCIRFGCFVVWKIVVAVYFVVWLALTVTDFIRTYPNHSVHAKWLIYLTNWTYLFFVSYCVVGAANVINEAVYRYRGKKNKRAWHFGLQWFLWNVGAPATLVVVLLFWAVLVPADSSIVSTASTVHVHLINGLAILVDQAIHAMPMQLLHLYQPLAYASAYAIFTGVYFASNGTDPIGNMSIYPVITDYSNHPALAVGADFVIVLIVIPTAWVFFWLLYKLRIRLCAHWDPHWTRRHDVDRAREGGEEGAGEGAGPPVVERKIELAVISQGHDGKRRESSPERVREIADESGAGVMRDH